MPGKAPQKQFLNQETKIRRVRLTPPGFSPESAALQTLRAAGALERAGRV